MNDKPIVIEIETYKESPEGGPKLVGEGHFFVPRHDHTHGFGSATDRWGEMDKEAITIARKHLDLPPGSMTDEEIAAGLEGSFLLARIEFWLAWRELWQAIKAVFTARP